MNLCQCPLGLIPHFYVREAISSSCGFDRGVNALSGLYLISTFAEAVYVYWFKPMSVNALSGLYLISTQTAHSWSQLRQWVSMPSRAYTSFLRWRRWSRNILMHSCQCPLGLIPHFYGWEFSMMIKNPDGVNALSGLYLISTKLHVIN